MSDTPTRDAKLVQLLNEAYTKEQQLESALEAHIPMTIRDDYAKRLKAHLKETKSHATQVSRRIKQLGGEPETASLAGPEGLSKAADTCPASWRRPRERRAIRSMPSRAPASRRRCFATREASTRRKRRR